MARPSKNTDQLLINAARELLPETGCTGLNLRQVAERAGVNLGMFHYHFKTKEEFTRRVLQDVYEEFFSKLNFETSAVGTPEQKLRTALQLLGEFSRDQRSLLVALIRDILNEDQEVIFFVKENFGRHFKLLLGIIKECKKSGSLQNLPDPILLFFLVGTIGFPHLIIEFLGRTKVIHPFGIKKIALHTLLLSESALKKRIQLAINAVSTRQTPSTNQTIGD